jgi:hypothetical protein
MFTEDERRRLTVVNHPRSIKVLPLEMWMTMPGKWAMNLFDEKELCQHSLTVIPPILNRDGFYKHYDLCWIEVDGKAYKYDTGMGLFDFDLANEDNSRVLRSEVMEAIQVLKRNKVFNKQLFKKWSKTKNHIKARNNRNRIRKKMIVHIREKHENLKKKRIDENRRNANITP